tara:strand:- start:22945 stop:23205 length:261 start_codon:yes stop_codon:yes gene_type:complete
MTKELNKDISQKISVISFAEIEQTDFFKKMPKFQKNFFQQNKKHVTHQIHHGFNVARNLGFEGWARQSNVNYQVQMIVKELNETRV